MSKRRKRSVKIGARLPVTEGISSILAASSTDARLTHVPRCRVTAPITIDGTKLVDLGHVYNITSPDMVNATYAGRLDRENVYHTYNMDFVRKFPESVDDVGQELFIALRTDRILVPAVIRSLSTRRTDRTELVEQLLQKLTFIDAIMTVNIPGGVLDVGRLVKTL